MFSKVSSIIPSTAQTWKNKIYLTFDIDWAHDDVVMDCYNLVSQYQVDTTWFATHSSESLDILRSDVRVELGIHPNFNKLLLAQDNSGDSSAVIRDLKQILPHATSVRSHSLTQSERLIDQFLQNGLTHLCNLYIPYSAEAIVAPFELWDRAIVVPHRFQDNAAIKIDDHFPDSNSLKHGFHVFNFHPIHVYLNTENLDRFEATREIHQHPSKLIEYRFSGYGTRSRLISLLNSAYNS